MNSQNSKLYSTVVINVVLGVELLTVQIQEITHEGHTKVLSGHENNDEK